MINVKIETLEQIYLYFGGILSGLLYALLLGALGNIDLIGKLAIASIAILTLICIGSAVLMYFKRKEVLGEAKKC